MTTAAIIAGILASAFFNTASPAVQAECAHASRREMVACVLDAERTPQTTCTDDTDCAAKFGGQY